jgi:hypothetical protein
VLEPLSYDEPETPTPWAGVSTDRSDAVPVEEPGGSLRVYDRSPTAADPMVPDPCELDP